MPLCSQNLVYCELAEGSHTEPHQPHPHPSCLPRIEKFLYNFKLQIHNFTTTHDKCQHLPKKDTFLKLEIPTLDHPSPSHLFNKLNRVLTPFYNDFSQSN